MGCQGEISCKRITHIVDSNHRIVHGGILHCAENKTSLGNLREAEIGDNTYTMGRRGRDVLRLIGINGGNDSTEEVNLPQVVGFFTQFEVIHLDFETLEQGISLKINIIVSTQFLDMDRYFESTVGPGVDRLVHTSMIGCNNADISQRLFRSAI